MDGEDVNEAVWLTEALPLTPAVGDRVAESVAELQLLALTVVEGEPDTEGDPDWHSDTDPLLVGDRELLVEGEELPEDISVAV